MAYILFKLSQILYGQKATFIKIFSSILGHKLINVINEIQFLDFL
jgi:hypothetical protein